MKLTDKLFIIFLISLFMIGCDLTDSPDQVIQFEQFEQAGLHGKVVNSFSVDAGVIYASTDDGLRSAEISGILPEWRDEGLRGLNVMNVVFLSNRSYLAGIRGDDVQSSEPVLYHRDPLQDEWDPFDQNYGGPDRTNYIYTLKNHPAQPDLIFARGAFHAARSTTGGEQWQTVFHDWDAMGYQADLLEFDPHDDNRVWIGGESSIFQPYLYVSEDLGNNWTNIPIEAGGDNAVYSMAFHPGDENRLLIGIEGAIWETDNHGESWDISFENDLYHYILVMATIDETPSETVFAAGTENGAAGGNIYFLLTRDFGENWEKRSAEPALDGASINDIAVVEHFGEIVVYLGTSEGVWMYKIDSAEF